MGQGEHSSRVGREKKRRRPRKSKQGKGPRSSSTERLAWGILSLLLALLVLAFRFDGLLELWFTLEPVYSTQDCHDPERGTFVFCDFAQYYYPQGQQIFESPKPLVGFFYPAVFALFMSPIARLGYDGALAVWMGLQFSLVLGTLAVPYLVSLSQKKWAAFVLPLFVLTSLPVLHNLVWGQVSVLLYSLVFGAVVSHQRGWTKTSAALLAVATSVKIFPIVWGLYFLVRKDWRTFAFFSSFVFALIVVLPALALGPSAAWEYHSLLAKSLSESNQALSMNPVPNSLTNVVMTFGLKALPGEMPLVARVLQGVSFLAAGWHLYLIRKLAPLRSTDAEYTAFFLLFSTIPFFVATSWVHYFVFLPFLQVFLLSKLMEQPERKWTKVVAALGLILPSLILVNVFAFVRVPHMLYYISGAPFFATALLLPLLYIFSLRLARLTATDEGCPVRVSG